MLAKLMIRRLRDEIEVKADATSANHFTPSHVTRYFSASSRASREFASIYILYFISHVA